MIKQNIFRTFAIFFLALFAWTSHAASIDALLHQANDPILGNPEGKITVVEFFDYECTYCSNMAKVLTNLIKANPNVRFVFKPYPVLGDLSWTSARAAMAAKNQGKYEEFNQVLFDSDSKESILKLAKSLGLNIRKLQKDMRSKKVTRQLNENINLAKSLEVKGTPTFYIGKTDATSINDLNNLLGELSESEMQSAIDKVSS